MTYAKPFTHPVLQNSENYCVVCVANVTARVFLAQRDSADGYWALYRELSAITCAYRGISSAFDEEKRYIII